jgi:hypothetical protein
MGVHEFDFDKPKEKTPEQLVLEKIQVAMNALYSDSHSWSDRPCNTCATVTKAIGQDFGCVRRRNDPKYRRTT